MARNKPQMKQNNWKKRENEYSLVKMLMSQQERRQTKHKQKGGNETKSKVNKMSKKVQNFTGMANLT